MRRYKRRTATLIADFGVALIALFACLMVASRATAAETEEPSSIESLAKLKQNPVGGLRQVGLDISLNPDVPGTDGTAGNYGTQIVWPFRLNEDWRLISYTILPVLQVPEENGDYKIGTGNTLLNFFVTPAELGKFVWGAGPAVLLPTRSDPMLGSDRVGLGPSAVAYYAEDKWGAGLVLQNVWSLGGEGFDEVNAFGAQYFLNYNLPQGWFLYSNSTITADWLSPSSGRWTVPVGGGVGKVFNIGQQPVSISFQGIENVIHPDNSPSWGLNFQIGFLFP